MARIDVPDGSGLERERLLMMQLDVAMGMGAYSAAIYEKTSLPPRVREAARQKIPFGIAQIGKAFRNEINPRNFTFRSREFEQAELEFFCHPSEREEWFQHWLDQRLVTIPQIHRAPLGRRIDNTIRPSPIRLGHRSKRSILAGIKVRRFLDLR